MTSINLTYCDYVCYQMQTNDLVFSVFLQTFHCGNLNFSHHSNSASRMENHHPSFPHPIPNGQRLHRDLHLNIIMTTKYCQVHVKPSIMLKYK
jgi:hypothetical protein